MVVARRRRAEQGLQQTMHAGGVKQVGAAHDVGDALRRVVHGDGQMVARRRVFARQNDVAPLGGIGGNGSGDIFIAFSTANAAAHPDSGLAQATFLPNDAINPVFEAAVDATSEAILNAMLAAETMTGADGYRVFALPHDRLLSALRKYGRVK